MEKIQNLIVGCGLSGVILARKIAEEKNEKVVIIDRRDHIGGNIYDYKDKDTNITIHKYGPHVFHTSIKEVWDFLSRFTKWHIFFYKVKAYIDGKEVNIPFNLDSLYKVFPKEMALILERKLIEKYGFDTKTTILELKNSNDKDLQFLADYIYKKVFLGYTVKQWGVKPEEIDPSVSARVPIYISKDDRYFQDTYQALPRDGYTKMIENILDHPLIEVRLKT
ncbi:NAD(P)-binding protein, partial [Campylobacter coli]|nr:NAD(P)-binding protein [Campylobacter coli]